MRKVDMSAHAVTSRLKRVEQLRRLCLSLQKAKPVSSEHKTDVTPPGDLNRENDTRKDK